MDLFNKDKSLSFVLLLFFLILPFAFFSSISDPFLLARQLLTTVSLSCILFFLVKSNKRTEHFTFDKTLLLFLGFIVFCLVSFSKSLIPDLSHSLLSKYLVFLLFFMLMRHSLLIGSIKPDRIISYIILFGVLSIIIASLAFLNKTIGGQHLFRQVDLMSGTFGNKNFLSSILFFCMPFYFIGISMSKKIKIISVVAITLTLILLLLLRTRAVLIALSLYLFLVLLFEIRSRFSKKTFLLSLSLFIISVIVGLSYLASIKVNFHSSAEIKTQYFYRLLSSETFYSRVEYWQQAIYVIKDNFFSGIGVGNWTSAYPKYGLHHFSSVEIQNGRMLISNPHNDFLLVFSEIGIFGFLCYLGIFVAVSYQAYWLLRNEAKSSDKKMVYYLFSFILCYLIIAFFDSPLARIEDQVLLLIVFAVVTSKHIKARKNGFKVPSRFIYLFSGAILIYATTILLYRINGEQHLLKAMRAEKRQDNATAIFEFNKAKSSFFSTDNYAFPLEWHLGKAEYNNGSIAGSLPYFLNAYNKNPYNIVINNDLGSALIMNGKIAEGMQHYKDALAISPKYDDARINLAATYFNAKEYQLAFETIDKCNVKAKNASYHKILTPIVEKKLNETLVRLNNTKLNNYLKARIKTEEALLALYFDYRKNNSNFDSYILSLIN